MTVPLPRTIVIGVGNEFRGDDGAGLAVARLLRAQLPPGIPVFEQSGEGTSLMDAWRNASHVLVIDAVHCGVSPGTIHRIDASTDRLPASLFPCSTHAFGVAEAIEMARALHELPPTVVLYGIEAATFEDVQKLSAEVARAVSLVSAQISNEVAALLGPNHPSLR